MKRLLCACLLLLAPTVSAADEPYCQQLTTAGLRGKEVVLSIPGQNVTGTLVDVKGGMLALDIPERPQFMRPLDEPQPEQQFTRVYFNCAFVYSVTVPSAAP